MKLSHEDLRLLDAQLADAEQGIRLARELIQRFLATLEENTPPAKNGDTPTVQTVYVASAEGHL